MKRIISSVILLKMNKKIQKKLNEKNIELKCFSRYDESFLTINGDKCAFLARIDSTNQYIINVFFFKINNCTYVFLESKTNYYPV